MTQISLRYSKSAKIAFKAKALATLLVPLAHFFAVSVQASDVTGLRVLPLTPALAEWTSELVGLEPIVGVTEYTDYPAGIEKKKNIGPFHRINFETAMSLKPTLVLASVDGNSKDQIELFKSKKIRVLVVDSSSFKVMIQGMKEVAQALGAEELGFRKLKPLEDRLKKLEETYRSRKIKKKVLIQVSSEPLVVVGRRTYFQDLLDKMRLDNVVEGATSTYPRLAIESVLSKNPDSILILAMKNDPQLNERMRSAWFRFAKLNAVKNERVRILMSDELMRPGLRLVQGIDAFEKALQESEDQVK